MEGLGVAVDEQKGCMPDSSRSSRGSATEALRVGTAFHAQYGRSSTDRPTFVLARASARALDLHSCRTSRSATAFRVWDLGFGLARAFMC